MLRENPMNYFDFWLGFDHYLLIPYNLYEVWSTCYYGIREIYYLGLDYIEFSKNLNILWFNMLYNMGTVIKNVSNLVMFFMAKEYTRVQDGFTFGLELGQIFWMTFYPNERYLRNLLKEGLEWSQDYTWDDVISLKLPEEI